MSLWGLDDERKGGWQRGENCDWGGKGEKGLMGSRAGRVQVPCGAVGGPSRSLRPRYERSWAHLSFQGRLSSLQATSFLSLNPQNAIGIRVSLTVPLSPP